MHVPYEATETLALIYATCRVIETEATATTLWLRIRGPLTATLRVQKAAMEMKS